MSACPFMSSYGVNVNFSAAIQDRRLTLVCCTFFIRYILYFFLCSICKQTSLFSRIFGVKIASLLLNLIIFVFFLHFSIFFIKRLCISLYPHPHLYFSILVNVILRKVECNTCKLI